MFFRRPEATNILNVNDYFANLDDVTPTNDYTFDFTYSLSQRAALSSNALRVNISVYTQLVNQAGVITTSLQNGQVDASSLVDNMRKQLVTAKTTKQQQESFLVTRAISDVTAFISNQNVNGGPDSVYQKQRLQTRSITDLQKSNETVPVLVFNNSQAQVNDLAHKRLYEDMLQHGQDPSLIVDMTRYSITPHDNVQGLAPSIRTRLSDISSAQLVLNAHTAPSQTPSSSSVGATDTQIVTLTTVTDDTLSIPVTIFIPRSKLKQPNARDYTTVYVVFDLVNTQTGAILQTVNKVLDTTKHVQMYFTPRTPPIVSLNVQSQQYVSMDIRPADEKTQTVTVYRKRITRSSTVIEDYTTLTTLSGQLKVGPVFKYRVPAPVDEIHIYRFVPVGISGIVGFDFTNVVIPPLRMRQKNGVAVSLQPVVAGIQIDVREFPTTVVALQIMSRNLTRFEKNFTNVDVPILIENDNTTIDTATYVDSNVIDGQYYEYAVKLFYRDGLSTIAGHKTISYNKLQPGKVSTKIANAKITTTGTPNLAFDVSTEVVSTDIDVARNLLQNSAVLQYFNGDVAKEREFFSSLIAHNIQRIDLKTGVREDFGVITDGKFNDQTLRDQHSVSPLELGRRYRYEIIALVRDPETLFDSLAKSRIDPVTKKPYSFNPSKFLHPLALQQGVLVSTAGLSALFGKDQMYYGTIGLTYSLEASFDTTPTQAKNLQSARFDRDLNLISWQIQGDVADVDHFLIAKNMNGIQTMIGKTHSEFQNGTCQFFHDLGPRDVGQFSYVVTPVFNDYTVGAPVTSNSLVIEGT